VLRDVVDLDVAALLLVGEPCGGGGELLGIDG